LRQTTAFNKTTVNPGTMATDGPAKAPSGPQARVIVQQCLNARLMVQPATEDEEAKYVTV